MEVVLLVVHGLLVAKLLFGCLVAEVASWRGMGCSRMLVLVGRVDCKVEGSGCMIVWVVLASWCDPPFWLSSRLPFFRGFSFFRGIGL